MPIVQGHVEAPTWIRRPTGASDPFDLVVGDRPRHTRVGARRAGRRGDLRQSPTPFADRGRVHFRSLAAVEDFADKIQ
jgi:hypothetical protein